MGETKADVGVIGMAVMGRNLALNIADHGNKVAIYNRSGIETRHSVTGDFVTGTEATLFRSDADGTLIPPGTAERNRAWLRWCLHWLLLSFRRKQCLPTQSARAHAQIQAPLGSPTPYAVLVPT